MLPRSTGVMFLEQRTADVSRAYYYRSGSAGSTLSIPDVDAALQGGARVVHLTGITAALSPEARRAVEYAAERAAGEGILVSLDVNYRAKLWSRDEARAALAPIARHATIVIASEDELDLVAPPTLDPTWCDAAAGLSDADEALLAKRLLEQGVREVVVKRGAAGAGAYTADGRWDVPGRAGDQHRYRRRRGRLHRRLPLCAARRRRRGRAAAARRPRGGLRRQHRR